MSFSTPHQESTVRPRLIIHGGAGNITRENLPPHLWHEHRNALLSILRETNALLHASPRSTHHAAPRAPGGSPAPRPVSALTAATYAVRLLERNPLFNAGRGAVFNRAGRVELEASVMVSRGYRKRGVGVSLVRRVKSPVGLAAEVLKRGEEGAPSDGGGWRGGVQGMDGGESSGGGGGGGGVGGGGAQGHVHLSGEEVERLAEGWGLEMCEESWFWTRKRWQEHKRGLEREKRKPSGLGCEANVSASSPDELDASVDFAGPDGHLWPADDASWNGRDYLPQGTVGCVVLDSYGTICVATSTGGITNKLPGRIGDTPTLGAGFWAEEWMEDFTRGEGGKMFRQPSLLPLLLENIKSLTAFALLRDCLPQVIPSYERISEKSPRSRQRKRAVAMSGTGNGDSFLLLCAVRTAAAKARFSNSPCVSLASAVQWMAGPGGELQRSAGERWHKTGEGEGGIIGIEMVEDVAPEGSARGRVVADFNCGGMFRVWVDEEGMERCMVFREEY